MIDLEDINEERYINEFKVNVINLGEGAGDISLYAPMTKLPIFRLMILKNKGDYSLAEIKNNALKHEDGIKLNRIDLEMYLRNEVHNRL